MQELEKQRWSHLAKPYKRLISGVLMAPTGRAAKVMSTYAKTKAVTIHKIIYFAQHGKQGGIQFKLQKNKFKKAVFIVDEASMIGDEKSSVKLFQNGSLLQDLIQYSHEGFQCKLVFVGDTAQLPPSSKTKPCLKSRLFVVIFFSRCCWSSIVWGSSSRCDVCNFA